MPGEGAFSDVSDLVEAELAPLSFNRAIRSWSFAAAQGGRI